MSGSEQTIFKQGQTIYKQRQKEMLGQNGKRQNETNIPNYADTGAIADKHGNKRRHFKYRF